VDDGQFFEAVDIGDGRRLDAQEGDFSLDEPLGELGRDARKAVSIIRRAEAAMPIGAEEEAVARANGVVPWAKLIDAM
jgi:hypothetical protein